MRTTDGRILSLRRLAAVLAALSALLAVILVAEIDLLFPEQEAAQAGAGAQRSIDLPELKTAALWPDVGQVSMDGRSLFLSKVAAQPAAPPLAEPQQPEPPQEQFALVAIVIAPNGRFALLRSQLSQELRQIQEGATVGNWSLAAVETDRVILEHGGRETILYLPDTIPPNP
jgi:hypothetical protein